MTGSGRARGFAGVAAAVAARPRLWRAGLRQARVLVPRGWWRRRPFLPVPDRDWLAFRTTTAYGDPDHPLVAEDTTTWLAWTCTVRPAPDTDPAPPAGRPRG